MQGALLHHKQRRILARRSNHIYQSARLFLNIQVADQTALLFVRPDCRIERSNRTRLQD
jgi:hypothetical protein